MKRVARHGSLRSEVYRRLRDDILQGRYKSGTALTEAQITLEMGVSRTPVREAISQLTLDGLVSSTPNKSIIVLGFDQQDISDLFDVRRNLEAMAAARAAENMNPEQLLELQAVFERESRETDESSKTDDLQDLDNSFHDMIFRSCGSKILYNLLSSINIYTRNARLVSLATPGRSHIVIDEHARIMQAIIARDSMGAAQAMLEHINSAAASFMAASKRGGKKND